MLNLGVSINNAEIRITTSNTVYSQPIKCPPPAGGSSSFWDRLKTAVGDFVSNVWNGIKDFFSSDDDGSSGGDDEGMGEEEDEQTEMQEKYDYGDDGFNYDPFGDNGQNPWDEPTFNNDNWGEQEWYIIENLAGAINYFQQEDNGFPFIQDSTLRIKNNLKPTRDTCIDLASKNASDAITNLYNKMDTLKGFQRVKDSALNGKNEIAISIHENSNGIDTVRFKDNGTPFSSYPTVYHPYFNIISYVHTHPVSSSPTNINYYSEPINTPSLTDIRNYSTALFYNSSLPIAYILTADGTKIALSSQNRDSAIKFGNFLDTIMALDPNTSSWSNTIYSPFKLTFLEIYQLIYKELVSLGYELKYIDLYANVIMMNNLFNSGIRLSILIDGEFKEIKAEVETIDLNKKIIKIKKINICK